MQESVNPKSCSPTELAPAFSSRPAFLLQAAGRGLGSRGVGITFPAGLQEGCLQSVQPLMHFTVYLENIISSMCENRQHTPKML